MIIRRYLHRTALSNIFILLLGFVVLFYFFDFLREVSHIGSSGYTLLHVFVMILCHIPGYIHDLMPVSVLIGMVYSLLALVHTHEWTILRLSGLSFVNAFCLFLPLIAVLALFSFLLNDFVVPYTERMALLIKMHAQHERSTLSRFASGFWIRDGHYVINVKHILTKNRFEGVAILAFSAHNELLSAIYADGAQYDARHGTWYLIDGYHVFYHFLRVHVVPFHQNIWYSSLIPKTFLADIVAPNRVSIIDLWPYIKYLKRNHQQHALFDIALLQKVLYPVTLLIMLGIALLLSYGQRAGGGYMGIRMVLAVLIGFLFHIVVNVFASIGVLNHWSSVWTIILPLVIFGAVVLLFGYLMNSSQRFLSG